MNKGSYRQWCQSAAGTFADGWFGQYVDVDGESVHYIDQGEGEPLLLLHGFMAWSYTWRRNVPGLARHTRSIALDLRGFGLSERDPSRDHSLDDQVELVRAFMDELSIPQAVVCGSSMGGEVALRLALRYPNRVKALILVGSAGYTVRTSRPSVERWSLALPGLGSLLIRMVVMNRRFAARTLRAAFQQKHLVSEADVDAYWLPARVPGSPSVFLRMLRDSDFGRTASELGHVTQPTLIIWGENDPWIPLSLGQRLRDAISGSRLVVFAACGHLPHEEYCEQFNEGVIQFLRSLNT